MKIVFMGTPEFALEALKALADEHEIIAVYTKEPKISGRGNKLVKTPVHLWAEERGIEVRTPKTLRNETEQRKFAELKADVAVVAAYGLILPQPVLDAYPMGCINIHASLLPRWRGAAPIQRSIEAGDKVSGVTIMKVAAGLDTGDMLLKGEVAITPDTTGEILHDKLAVLGGQLVLQTLRQWNDIIPQPQDDALSCYAAKIEKEWWGSLVMQYHKHLYHGIMKRWRRKGYYSETRGSNERGANQDLIDFLCTEFVDLNSISKEKAKNNNTNIVLASIQTAMLAGIDSIQNMMFNWDNLSEDERANIRRTFAENAAVLSAVLFVMAIYAAWDDDDIRNNGFVASLLYISDRLYSDSTMYNPMGITSEIKTTWSSPVASATGPSDFITACNLITSALFDPDFNPEYQTGLYAHKNKFEVLLRRNIPGLRPYDRIQLITRNNQYYKIGESQIGINIGRKLGEALND